MRHLCWAERGEACGAGLSSSVLLAVAVAVSACAGCGGDRFAVPEGERRPDSVVETFPPTAVCRHEVVDAGAVAGSPDGRALATLVRWRDSVLLVRLEPGPGEGPAKLAIDRVDRAGRPVREGTTSETGAPATVTGIAAVAGGDSLVVALTRDDGRVDLLALTVDGAPVVPVAPLALEARSPARLLWFDGPVLSLDGAVLRPDGLAQPSQGGDAGPERAPPAPDGGTTDGGDVQATLPRSVDNIVVAGEALGWTNRAEDGIWLNHQSRTDASVRTVRVAGEREGRALLLWAGDRYLVGSPDLRRIARYIPSDARGRRDGPELNLGGALVIPVPPGEISLAAWGSAGPRHVGIAQALGPRHLRFVNIALAGQTLDAEIHVHPSADVVDAAVLWDGSAYVLLWTEAQGPDARRLGLARFVCPDET